MIAEIVRQRGAFTSDTLRLMRGMVDDWSKTTFCVQLARQICDQVGASSFAEESRAIWGWIRSAVAYRLDPVETQWIQDPYETAAVSKAGNCANMAILAGALLQALGHPVTLAAIRWDDRDDFSHAVVFDKLTGLMIDPVNSKFDEFARKIGSILEA
jgi:transglutaminase-like putative cysteine protease